MTWVGGGGFPPRTRRAILARDGHQCTYTYPDGTRCTTASPLEADHVVPEAEARLLGWTDDQAHDETNGATLCKPHHWDKTKADMIRGQRRARAARPRKRPTKPHPGLTQHTQGGG